MSKANMSLTRIDPMGDELPYTDLYAIPDDIVNASCNNTAVHDFLKKIAKAYVTSQPESALPAGMPFTVSDFVSIPDEFLAQFGVEHLPAEEVMVELVLDLDETLARWPRPKSETDNNTASQLVLFSPATRDEVMKYLSNDIAETMPYHLIPSALNLLLHKQQVWQAELYVTEQLAKDTDDTVNMDDFVVWSKAQLCLQTFIDKMIRDSIQDLLTVMAIVPKTATPTLIKMLQALSPLGACIDSRRKTPPEAARALLPHLNTLHNIASAGGRPTYTKWQSELLVCTENIRNRMALLDV